jgi:hypothetical protein
VHGSVERRSTTHRLAAPGRPHTRAATAKTASSAASCVCRCACRPHPSPDQPRHLTRTITSACPPRANQVVCHELSRSLADSLARVQTWIYAGEPDQRTSLTRKRSIGANVGATQANDLPRQRTNADMRPTILPARGSIRTTLNAIQVTTDSRGRRRRGQSWLQRLQPVDDLGMIDDLARPNANGFANETMRDGGDAAYDRRRLRTPRPGQWDAAALRKPAGRTSFCS